MLLTRPRRFGKTLTQTTLKAFLELNYADPGDVSLPHRLFSGLDIANDEEFCRRHMGQYPVIYLSFKDTGRDTFSEVLSALSFLVSDLYSSFEFVLKEHENCLATAQKIRLQKYFRLDDPDELSAPEQLIKLLVNSLSTLRSVLYRIYQR